MVVDKSEQVAAIIEPTVEGLGFELVRVTFSGGKRPTLQVMAERADGGMSVEDCADLSRELSAVLDVEDPIASDYFLEVSSPGIDRPLTRPKDFDRFSGFDVRVEMQRPIDGRRRFKGRLEGLQEDRVLVRTEEGDVASLPYEAIAKAKLVLTDDLINATGPRADH